MQIPLPIYRLVSIGGDTSFTANVEYRIPIVNQVTFAFFTDFNMTFDVLPNQLRQSVAGQSLIASPLYGCPTFINGACFGGQQVDRSHRPLRTVPGTNWVPRMSNGAELQVILPIVNAPFRIYYAYNSLRSVQELFRRRWRLDCRDVPELLPDLGCRGVHVPGGDPALRRGLCSA